MSEIISFNTEEIVKENLELQKQQFKTYEIIPETSSILKDVIPKFDFNSGVNPTILASELVETLKLHNAYGLAANQCGLPYRVFVMGYGEEYVAFFNPEIIEESEETDHNVEGCLSFPGLTLYITRPKKIKVKYQDFTGEYKENIFEGLTARIFIHELDHLNGVVYTNRAKPLALKNGLSKRDKYFKKVARMIVKQKRFGDL